MDRQTDRQTHIRWGTVYFENIFPSTVPDELGDTKYVQFNYSYEANVALKSENQPVLKSNTVSEVNLISSSTELGAESESVNECQQQVYYCTEEEDNWLGLSDSAECYNFTTRAQLVKEEKQTEGGSQGIDENTGD